MTRFREVINHYINGLENVKELLKGHTEPVVIHTDQGSVYASMAHNESVRIRFIQIYVQGWEAHGQSSTCVNKRQDEGRTVYGLCL